VEVPQLLANIGNVLQALLGGITGPEDLQEAVEAEARAIVGAAAVPIVGEEEARVGWQPEELSFRPVPGEQAELGGSSWQSLVRGTGTIETDFLNGEITLIARRLGRAAPINTRLTSKETTDILRDAEASVVIRSQPLADRDSGCLVNVHRVTTAGREWLEDG